MWECVGKKALYSMLSTFNTQNYGFRELRKAHK